MRPQEPVTRAFFATKSSLTQGPGVTGFERRLWLARIAVAACAVFCIANWTAALAAVRDLYVVIPFMDYWRVAEYLQDILHWDFHFLWNQHNEHRIVFPDIAFALDVLWFHGRRLLPIVLNCLCYAGSWALLVYPAAKDPRISRIDRALIVLISGAVISWKGCALVLADPFLLSWALASFTSLAAFTFLFYSKRSHTWALAGTIGCAAIANYSFGNGLLLWPLLLAIGILLRLTKLQIAVLFLSACTSIGLYFIGYHFGKTGNFDKLLSYPAYAAGFVETYIGMPFGMMKSPHFSMYLGIAVGCAFLALLYGAIRSRNLTTATGVVLCGWYTFMLLSAVIAAAARMHPGDPNFTEAKPARYLLLPLLAWGAVVVWFVWTAALRKWRIFSPPLLVALIGLLLLLANRKLQPWFDTETKPFVAAQMTELSLENNLFDPGLIHSVFPGEAFVARFLPQLKTANLSIYYHSPGQLLGQQLSICCSPAKTNVEGSATRITPLISGVEVVGFAKLRGLSHVFLVNPEAQ